MKTLHAVRQDVQPLPIVVPRADLDLIESWVPMGARVLDLGCGDGSFLARLMKTRKATGYGVEIDDSNVQRSVANGINVIQQDLEKGLAMFEDHAFDVVIFANPASHAQHRANFERDRPGGQRRHCQLPKFWSLVPCMVDCIGPHASVQTNALSVVQHAEHSPVHPQRFRGAGCSNRT